MKLKLYNSLTRRKEDFSPIDPKEVKMYVCGPTVYDYAHLGNARPPVVFDTLFRLLSIQYPVTYVRNITDVDDKIIKAAKEKNESISALTERTIQNYHADMDALSVIRRQDDGAHHRFLEPRATTHIPEMVELITILLDKEHAYVAENHVLFDTTSYESYGQLSRRDLEEMIEGARVEVAPYKKNPADFVLWKPSTEDQPGWESPWGRGRPGWHIECSAMSHKHLGETFDIHGGGLDLIFPHHENEIAQSICAFGAGTFARIWIHNGMLMVNGKKMAKSLGNFFTVRDLLKQYPGEVIRLTLLSAHYRQPLDWTEQTVNQMKAALDRFYTCLRGLDLDETARPSSKVLDALCDDLNTPLALSALHELSSQINACSDDEEKKVLASELKVSAGLMGVLQQDPDQWFQTGKQDLSSHQIEALINQREAARKVRDFDKADKIRQALEKKGVLLEDSAEGTVWKVKK